MKRIAIGEELIVKSWFQISFIFFQKKDTKTLSVFEKKND